MDGPMTFLNQLLATKFFGPSASHHLIERPRLITLLNQGLLRKLTLISAPAGFGKTTLLSTWVELFQQENPEAPHVAWISLDKDDNEPLRFWTYVLTALETQQPGLCTPLLGYLHMHRVSTPPLRYVLQALINTLTSRTRKILLVFDDYRLITEPEVHSSLSYLIEHLPPQLHIILATRADPPLPLSLLRSHGEVLEVRTDQLRCTSEEELAFFREVMGKQLPNEIIQDVVARIEGWLAGLQLLGLTLQGQADPTDFLKEVSGRRHYILDYLIEEVLWRQPSVVQTFLMRTSILERLSAPLCDAVLKRTDSQKLLGFLERSNVFVIPLDGHRRWYRYRSLFAEALRSQQGPNLVDLNPSFAFPINNTSKRTRCQVFIIFYALLLRNKIYFLRRDYSVINLDTFSADPTPGIHFQWKINFCSQNNI
ncbi:MAG: P-loop domain-containing protein [Ktedonobacteraceae bacterium]